MCACLDMLNEPDHHPEHREWAASLLSSMTEKERQQFVSAHTTLGRFLDLDLYFDIRQLAVGEDGYARDFSVFISNRANHIQPAGRELSDEQRSALVSFLTYFHDAYFWPVVENRRVSIQSQIQYGRNQIEKLGAATFIESLSERIQFDSSRDLLLLEKHIELSFDAAQMQLFEIQISLFSFPHMMVGFEEPDYFSLAWDVPFTAVSRRISGIDSLSDIAFALSDKSRLRMLMLIARQRMNQKDIGQHMGYAKSTISRHISILEQSGIIRKMTDESGQRYFQLNRKLLSSYSSELLNWID